MRKLIDQVKIFDKMFDFIRILDPIKKEVL